MKVHRILIPSSSGTSWSPYTNNIIANDLFLMPVQQSDERQIIRDAVQTYHELMPEHTIATVDTTTLKDLQGALHCMSINIPGYAPLPHSLVEYQRAVRWVADPDDEIKRAATSRRSSSAETFPKSRAVRRAGIAANSLTDPGWWLAAIPLTPNRWLAHSADLLTSEPMCTHQQSYWITKTNFGCLRCCDRIDFRSNKHIIRNRNRRFSLPFRSASVAKMNYVG